MSITFTSLTSLSLLFVVQIASGQSNLTVQTAPIPPTATSTDQTAQTAASTAQTKAAAQKTVQNNQATNKAASGPSFSLFAVADKGKASPVVGVSGDIASLAEFPTESDTILAITATGSKTLQAFYDLKLKHQDEVLKVKLDSTRVANAQKALAKAATATAVTAAQTQLDAAKTDLKADEDAYYTDEQTWADECQKEQLNLSPTSRLTIAGVVAAGVQSGTGDTIAGVGIGPRLSLNHGDITLMAGGYWASLQHAGFLPQLMVGLSFNFQVFK